MSPSCLQPATDKLVVALITSLNAARRAVCCYPPGHPAVDSSFEKITALCRPFFHSRKELVFGFTTQGIIFDGDYLDTRNPIYLTFAYTLFQHGIGAVILDSTLTVQDLKPFIQVLTLRREAVLAEGGIEKLWGKTSSAAISILPVRYELFEAGEVSEVTEGSRGTQKEGPLWEQFLRQITSKDLCAPCSPRSQITAVPVLEAEGVVADNPHEERLVTRELHAELQDLQPDAVTMAVEKSLLFLFLSSTEPCHCLEETIAETYRRHLAAGRYGSVARFVEEGLAFPARPQTRERLIAIFASNLHELMSGIRSFGKAVYAEATNIIDLLGPACVPDLLYHLGEEPSMQIRRFIIGRIIKFGSAGERHLISALSDTRWYFIRNVLVIVREMKVCAAAGSVRCLLTHRSKIVREEALKTLLQLRDVHAYAKLAQDMTSSNRDTRLSALRLCTGFPSEKMFGQLTKIALKFGATSAVYEERRAAVAALAESGKPEAIIVLSRILESRNVLAPLLHLELQKFCLTALEKFFVGSEVRPIAHRLCQQGGKLGATASAALIRMGKGAT